MNIKSFLLIACFIFTSLVKAEELKYDLEGDLIKTVQTANGFQSGVYTVTSVMPNDNDLPLPYYFEGNPDQTDIKVFFDDQPLPIISGDPLYPDNPDMLMIDISTVKAQSGRFKVELSSTGDTHAELLILSKANPTYTVDQPATPSNSNGSSGSGSITYPFLILMLIAIFIKRRLLRVIYFN